METGGLLGLICQKFNETLTQGSKAEQGTNSVFSSGLYHTHATLPLPLAHKHTPQIQGEKRTGDVLQLCAGNLVHRNNQLGL